MKSKPKLDPKLHPIEPEHPVVMVVGFLMAAVVLAAWALFAWYCLSVPIAILQWVISWFR